MSADEVLAELAKEHSARLLEALESADAHRNALAGPLLRALEAGLADPDGLPEADAQLFTYALYLVAKWRETRAYPLVVRWLSLPGELAFDLAGDVVTQDGGRILAAVCDGDLRPVRKLILNRDANEFGRSAGVFALTLLALWAEVPRDAILAELQWLAREGLEREPSFVWAALAGDCADIEMFEILPEIRRAFEDGLIDPMDVTLDEIEQDAASARGRLLETTRERYPPIDDIAEATSWFARAPSPERAERLAEMLAAGELDEPYDAVPIEPYRAPPKVGRNEPCPCGSGKKYKKCCGA